MKGKAICKRQECPSRSLYMWKEKTEAKPDTTTEESGVIIQLSLREDWWMDFILYESTLYLEYHIIHIHHTCTSGGILDLLQPAGSAEYLP